MAPATRLVAGPSSDSLGRAGHPHLGLQSWRRDAFRRGLVVAVALSLGTLVLTVSLLVGKHLLAAWWLEGLHGAVDVGNQRDKLAARRRKRWIGGCGHRTRD